MVKRLQSQLLHIFGQIEAIANPPFSRMSGAANRIDYCITAAKRDSMAIEGLLMSIDAYKDQSLRLPMKNCIAKLEQTGKFEER